MFDPALPAERRARGTRDVGELPQQRLDGTGHGSIVTAESIGARERNRTADLRITSALLCRLSYSGEAVTLPTGYRRSMPLPAEDLTWIDAVGQADLVRSGQASPTELVEAAIDRIERVNPQLNAVIHERFDRARQEAAGELPDGPFRGVPLLLKDLACEMEGEPYHYGTRFLKEIGWRSDHDTAFVGRLRRAGFVIVGKTNVPEFGASITTEPEAYGPTHNPWNLERSTGGSSGGSAASVAAGLVPAAHGNDGGGSIRIPANECGLVGLKPTRARVSQAPDGGAPWNGGTIDGVLTRTVRDTAAILDVMSGAELGDPYPAPPLARPLVEEVGAPPGNLRVGVMNRPPMAGVTPDAQCRAAVDDAAALLESLGHKIEPAHPEALGEADFLAHFGNLSAASSAADLAEWEQKVGRPLGRGDIEADNLAFVEMGRALPAPQYEAAIRWMHGFQRRMAAWWSEDGFDLLLSPVLNGVPPALGSLKDPTEGLGRVLELIQYTAQFNMTGQPGISVPLYWTSDGLPIGVQLVAAYGREDLLIRVAAQLEQARPWASRIPPVHA